MMRTRGEIIEKALQLGYVPRPEEEIRPGDYYLAWRNGEPKRLKCKEVRPDREDGPPALRKGWVIPVTQDYAYDIPECVKVILGERRERVRA